MEYVSSRDKGLRVSAAQAIAAGIAPGGGLFCPTEFPALSADEMQALLGMDYKGRAAHILGKFLTDFSAEELTGFAAKAYADEKFGGPDTAPVKSLADGVHMLELWHGPTCAFKDMALQMLPHLLTASLRKTGETRTCCILVATSGDTGKAALEGFADVPGTKIMVYYPVDGVSPMQKLQMVTQQGQNVEVVAIEGNFDDAQSAVKRIFTDADVIRRMNDAGCIFSSANSINWGRLAPQIAYYVSAYCDLVTTGKIAMGDPVNVCVPTGNFGNILAAYIAKQMGLPVGKLVCASNQNNVLTDFFRQGGKRRRDRLAGQGGKRIQLADACCIDCLTQRGCNRAAELEGARRRGDDHRGAVSCARAVIRINLDGDCGMGVKQIALCLENPADRLRGLRVVAAARIEIGRQFVPEICR